MGIELDHQKEIAEQRAVINDTRRSVSPDLEEILYQPIPILDHGFIRVIDYMGNDAAVTQAARVSYGRGTKQVNQEEGLIDYLMRHYHTTPFEMCEIKYHVKLPIFVARQWIRHRTASINEYSARYSILAKEFYLPEREHLAVQSATNRQGRAESLPQEEAARVLELLKEDSERVYDHYQDMLNADEQGNILDPERSGLTRELARMNLTLNYYTEWYWKTNLHNLMHFVRLRADAHAQYEIRVYAEAMLDTMRRWVPLSYDAFVNYRQQSISISRLGHQALQAMLSGQVMNQEKSRMGKREWQEFCEAFNLDAETGVQLTSDQPITVAA